MQDYTDIDKKMKSMIKIMNKRKEVDITYYFDRIELKNLERLF